MMDMMNSIMGNMYGIGFLGFITWILIIVAVVLLITHVTQNVIPHTMRDPEEEN